MKFSTFAGALLSAGLMAAGAVSAQNISMNELGSAPTLDGSDVDWSSVPATKVALAKVREDGKSAVTSVTVKGGVYGDEVYLLLQWSDDSHNIEHKPYVWDEANKKYGKGKAQEEESRFPKNGGSR